MKNVSIAMFISILSVCSCSKKDETPDCAIRLSKIHISAQPVGGSATESTFEYEYDNEQRLVKLTQTTSSYVVKDSISYSDGSVALIRETRTGNIPFVEDNVWNNSNGRVSKIVSYTVDNPSQTGGENFFYNSAGALDSITILNNDVPNGQGLKYTYDGSGNLQTYTTSGFGYNQYSYDGYDNKKNPYTLLANAIHQPQYSTPDGTVIDYFLFIHNPATIQRVTIPTSSQSLSYVYNADDYPTKIIGTSSDGTIVTRDFEYIKACP